MKMTVEFNSIADLANFSKFIDQRLTEEQKATELNNLTHKLNVAQQQLERAYARLRFRDDGPDLSKVENILLEQVPLKVRTHNCLRAVGCRTVGDVLKLFDKTKLLGLKNFGNGSFSNLKRVFQYEYKINLDRSSK